MSTEARLGLDQDIACQEIVVTPSALAGDAALGFQDGGTPGAAVRSARGASVVLHFAPGRWLLTGTALATEANRIAQLRQAGALIIDGAKWCRLKFEGAGSRQMLSELLPIEQVLGTRGCAATTLLECPGVLASSDRGLDFWVGRSYAAWLHETLAAWLIRRSHAA